MKIASTIIKQSSKEELRFRRYSWQTCSYEFGGQRGFQSSYQQHSSKIQLKLGNDFTVLILLHSLSNCFLIAYAILRSS